MNAIVSDKPLEAKPEAEPRVRRRRREGQTEVMGLRLPIPDEVYEKYPVTGWKHYWFRDEPGRIQIKHKEDWDVVEGIEPIPGTVDRNGVPCNHILCVKRKEFWDEDKGRKEEMRKSIEGQMERGKVSGAGEDAGEGLSETISYTDGANRLS